MSRNVNRLCVVIVATAGLGAVPIATADPAASTSPGVPCVEIVQQLAASPPDIQEPLLHPAAAVEAALPPVPVVAAPLAGGVPPMPPIPAIPDIASLSSLALSQVSLPTVPGLPVQLPSELSMPHDLICEGTAWSASKPDTASETAPPVRRTRGGW